MKVLMFGWEFPPYNSGGLGVACWGLTRALSRLNIDVTFVLPRTVHLYNEHCKVVFADKNCKGLSFAPVDVLLMPYISEAGYGELQKTKDAMYGSSLFQEVLRYGVLAREIAKTEVFDVIHAHDWLSFEAGIEAKRVSNKPLIVHVHATEFDRCGGDNVNPSVYKIEKRGMEVADRIVAVSEFTKNIIIQKYGIEESKIKVVHNGVDEEDFIAEVDTPRYVQYIKSEGKKIVLFVGRVTLQKGPDYFLEVARKVLEKDLNVLFVVAGSGDMEPWMIRQVASMGLSDHFVFTGFLRGDDLASIYKSADLYIMPSVSEPFGIAPLEAIAHGTPVLISKQAGVSEVLQNALRADFWDIDDMVQKTVGLLRHDPMQKTLTDSGKVEIKNINWKVAARKVIMLYRDLRDLKITKQK